jgi:hypothetical protein
MSQNEIEPFRVSALGAKQETNPLRRCGSQGGGTPGKEQGAGEGS